MQILLKQAFVLIVAATALSADPAGAQTLPQADPGQSAEVSAEASALTGKERLSGKWADEQRMDNCKVPPGRRGPKPRPDSCPPIPRR